MTTEQPNRLEDRVNIVAQVFATQRPGDVPLPSERAAAQALLTSTDPQAHAALAASVPKTALLAQLSDSDLLTELGARQLAARQSDGEWGVARSNVAGSLESKVHRSASRLAQGPRRRRSLYRTACGQQIAGMTFAVADLAERDLCVKCFPPATKRKS